MKIQVVICFLYCFIVVGSHATAFSIIADLSKVGTDGPHIFYKENGTIEIKTVVFRDSIFQCDTQIFLSKKEIRTLTCQLPGNEKFNFKLQDTLKNEPTRYAMPEKILVISDIEGHFEAFKILLQGAKVMDTRYRWTFGKGHLVMVGDFFDRGLHVTETLWLIYKLEKEAEAAGGKVHFILGNHEVMNLSGDFRYVRNKYMENAELIGEPYQNWYSEHTELGRWLRTKNAIEIIGTEVYCHGGISETIFSSNLTLEKINELTRQNLGKTFKDIENPEAQIVFNSKTGIFWFRDVAKKQVSPEYVNQGLVWAGAKRMIVGHTVMPQITATYNGKIICVDVFHEENLRVGFLQTLWVERGNFYIIDHRGEKTELFDISYPRP